jgi:putative Holliday junction resolvase
VWKLLKLKKEKMKLAALDIGLKRIGIAISPDGKIVTPLKAVIRHSRKQASQDVSKILKEWQIEKLIVGIPKNHPKSDEMKRRFEHFINLLDFQNEVIFENEALTTFEAKNLMEGEFKIKKDGRIDSLSAKIILEQYLNHHI